MLPLVIFLGYAAVTVIMTWPVAARLGTHLVGTGDDMWVQYWNNWWVKRILTEGGSVYSTRMLFYPQTVSLVYHNFGWVNIAAWLVIEPIVGGIAAYNLVYLSNITLCAFAMFLLARYLLKSEGPAFIAGLVYGCWPYRLSDYNHPNTISTGWLPLALLCVILLVREGGRARHALSAGLFLALTALSRWQMLLPAAIAIGVYLLYSALFERGYWSWQVAGTLALAALVTALLVAVPFYPLAHDLLTGETSTDLYLNLEGEKQTDLLAYFVPPMNHPLAALFDNLSYVRSPVRFRYSAFLGYTVLAVALIAVIPRWRAARLWTVLALVAFLLALGPVLRLDGSFYSAIPMPYRLVGWSAPFRLMRNPHRFNVLLALPVAVLAGYGATVLRERLTRARSALLWGILSALILFDYFNLPAATVRAAVPDFYAILSQEECDFAVLDLPLGRDHGDYYMFYQTVHGHPIVEGNTARPQPYMFAFIDGNTMLRSWREGHESESAPDDISRQLGHLAEAGIYYIVMHKPFAKPGQLDAWSALLPLFPYHEDDEALVYRTALEYGQDFDFATELGDGVGLIDGTLSTTVLPQDGLLEADLRWGTKAAPTRNWIARLALATAAGKVAQAVDVEPCIGCPTLEWGANAVARGRASLQVDPFIEGGVHTVTLLLLDSDSADTAGEGVVLGQIDVQAVKRSFDAPEMSESVNATFGDALRLLGYDLHQSDDALTLTLHWQALRRMDTAYKIFVHLFDPATGGVVAQADVMPRDWGYPTHWWEVNEVVSDPVRLSLKGLPPGTYRLTVGVYDPTSLERLSVGGAGDQVTLGETVHLSDTKD